MSVIEIVFVCLIGILFVCVSFVVCLRYFHIFQQNHYSLSNTINYFYNTNNIQFTLQIILIGIIDFVALDIINQIVCAIDLNYLYFISFPLLFYSLYICKYNKKSIVPIKYTKRLFRLIFTYIVLNVLFTFTILHISYCYFEYTKYSVLGIVFFLQPFICILSSILIYPIEKINIKRINNKTKRIVEKHRKHIKVIAVTGSFGKTSIKNILYNILSQQYNVCVCPKNYNTPMGIAYTVKNLDNTHDILLLEYGADHVGDIDELCNIIRPDISILSGIAPQHLSTFGSIENIVEEKCKILKYAKECIVYDSECDYVKDLLHVNEKAKNLVVGKDVFAKNIKYASAYTTFDCYYKNKKMIITTTLLGSHNIKNIMFAILVAKGLNISDINIIKGIQKTKAIEHRLQRKFIGQTLVLDDSYNINIKGALSALEVLEKFDKNKIVITSGIVDDIENISKNNEILSRKINDVCDMVFIIGRLNYDNMIKYIDKNKVYFVNRIEEINFNQFGENDIVLMQTNLPDNYEV